MVEKRRQRSDRCRLISVSAVCTRGERLHKIRDRPPRTKCLTPLKLLSTDYVLQSKICPRLSLKASRAENGFYLYFRREIASDSKSNGKTTRNLRSFAISFLRCVWFMCSLKLQQKMRVGKDLLASFSILFSQGGSCSA